MTQTWACTRAQASKRGHCSYTEGKEMGWFCSLAALIRDRVMDRFRDV